MKYGILIHPATKNLGDDMQSYASAKLLPQVHYTIDREAMDSFRSEADEPVGVMMAHWWFWKKWNWPPSDCIYPCMTGIHINLNDIYKNGTPVKESWLQGIGGDYLKAYGPVGVRDQATLAYLKENRIPAYFSGSVVLTLPKQEKTEDSGTYVVLVDMNETQTGLIEKKLEGSGINIISVTHKLPEGRDALSLEQRFSEVEEKLKLYQNARCVITKRLTVALACLAMEVPVLAVVNLTEESVSRRWNPYKEWVHFAEPKAFKEGRYDFDFQNPPSNPGQYLAVRKKLMEQAALFVKDCEANSGKTKEELKKTSYTAQEARLWQNRLMKETLEAWLHASRGMLLLCEEKEKKIRVLNRKVLKKRKPVLEDFFLERELEALKNRQPAFLKRLKDAFQ